jgi:hypothetical protein
MACANAALNAASLIEDRSSPSSAREKLAIMPWLWAKRWQASARP